MNKDQTNKQNNNSFRILQIIGFITLCAIGIYLPISLVQYIDKKDKKITNLESIIDSLKNGIIPLEDSLKKEKKDIEFFKAESNYRLHRSIMEEGPTKNNEEFHGLCKLYTYKEIKDSFKIVEDRYHQLLWKRE